MKYLLLSLPLIVILALLPGPKPELVNLSDPGAVDSITLAWPAARYVLEPAAGMAEYFLSFTRYLVQLGSWLFWMAAAVIVIGVARRRRFSAVVRSLLFAWTIVLTCVVAALLVPFPTPRLLVPDPYLAVVDLHSHTDFSHDAVRSPAASLAYHRRLGFTSFFVTEHGHTDSFFRFPEQARFSTVFPGMQVSTKERVSLLVLADRAFDGRDFLHQNVADVIRRAHERGFIVICPHWWKWRYFTWQQLKNFGIDGFEVYNAGYRKFSEAERTQLIDFCRANNLLMTGSTDWHGWGSFSNVWTLVRLPEGAPPAEGLFSALREHRAAGVIEYDYRQKNDTLRYALEPFFGVYYYFSRLKAVQILSWCVWIVLAALFAAWPSGRRSLRLLPLLITLILAAATISCLIQWVPLLPENQILGRLLAPVLAVLVVSWFFFGVRMLKKPRQNRLQ